ncbi:hypothetical protein KBX19_11085, partial [Corynebacterium sp. CCUG 71335]|nr:hypothetical protein [Corynebacterium sp. CCUG 71335]
RRLLSTITRPPVGRSISGTKTRTLQRACSPPLEHGAVDVVDVGDEVVDVVVVFDALTQDQLVGIVDIQLRGLAARLAERRLVLEVSDPAKRWLADRGYDPAYGARPLRRLIQKEIGDKLAKEVLAGETRDGEAVRVDADPEGETLDVNAK